MIKISPDLLQKIRDSVNIIEVVGEHVVLRKSGSNYSGLCPFHSERSPSFSVSELKGLYHCYGCKKGGDLFGFVMDIHGLSFPEAVEELADRGKVALPKGWSGSSGSPEEDQRRAAAREKLDLGYKLNRFVAAFYHHNLGREPEVQEYFRKRGVSSDEIRNFYVGSAPAAWDGLSQHLVSKKAPLDTARDLGLIRPSPKSAPQGGIGYFDLFRARAMFPILDLRGKVVGFGGRSLPGSDTDGPKYMNSPESSIFHKSKIAYGLFQAQKHAREKDELIMVEGYFDVIALHAAGFQNVVATCGTALTVDHLNLFRKFASKITVLFDGDKAGISATERAMELGLTQGAILYGAAMPENLDPDELLFDQKTGAALPEGKTQMQQILESAKPLLDSRIADQIDEAAKGPEARTQALKQIGQWLAEFRDPVGCEIRMQDVQSKLGISRQLLEQAMGKKPSAPTPPSQNSRRPQAPMARPASARSTQVGPSKPSATDLILLRSLALGGKPVQEICEVQRNLPPGLPMAELFDYLPFRAFLTRLAPNGLIAEEFRIPEETASDPEIDPSLRSLLTEIWLSPQLSRSSEEGSPESELRGALNKSMARVWARFSQRIRAALQDAEAKKDAGLHAQLSKEYLDVQRKMKEFNSFYDEA